MNRKWKGMGRVVGRVVCHGGDISVRLTLICCFTFVLGKLLGRLGTNQTRKNRSDQLNMLPNY